MENFILAYIAQRMAETGFKSYHFEPFVVVMDSSLREVSIDARNEFYYLTSKSLVSGTEISSDTNIFKADDTFGLIDYWKIQEFTGQIKITYPKNSCKQVVEFIRVIPE